MCCFQFFDIVQCSLFLEGFWYFSPCLFWLTPKHQWWLECLLLPYPTFLRFQFQDLCIWIFFQVPSILHCKMKRVNGESRMVPLFGLFQLYLNGADLTPEFRAKLVLQWVWIKPWKGLNCKMLGLFWNLKGPKQSLKIWLSYKWPLKKEPIWLSKGSL